jgi:circadian clock protein KaiC
LIERAPIGIQGLDEMLEGGLPVPSLILLAGDVGSGKTTFCSQFLFKGAELGEPGLCFLTVGGSPEWVLRFISTYDFADSKFLGKEIAFVDLESVLEQPQNIQEILEAIKQGIEKYRPKRVVIDCLSILEDLLKEDFRRFVIKLSNLIKEYRAVALVTGESLPGKPYPVEIAQVADGVILLQNVEVNFLRRRSIEVLKMSGTAHHLGKYAVDITAKGMTVYPGL